MERRARGSGPRPARLLGWSVLLLVLSASTALVAARVLGVDEDDAVVEEAGTVLPMQGPSPAPEGDLGTTLAQSRYEAALIDVRVERERIQVARERFATELRTSPSTKRDYVLSFEHPIAALDVLDALAVRPQIEVRSIFTWLGLESSINVITGEHSADDLGWPGDPTETARWLRSFYVDYLARRGGSIARGAIEGVGGDAPPVAVTWKERTAELGVLKGSAAGGAGVRLFGLRCICAPGALTELEEALPLLTLRTVELAGDYRSPVWPRDLLRDSIIATKGTYGI